MADLGNWSLEIDAQRLAWLSCDTRGASTNVLSRPVLEDLDRALAELERQHPAGLIVFSAKPGGFIAGADIKEFLKVRIPDDAYALVRAGQTVLDRLEALPCPSVAAIHGFALGGGLELALACRHRIGADDARLALGVPEVLLGIHPGFGGTVRLVRLIGARAALDLMLKGKPLRGERALTAGLIDALAPPAELRERARQLVLERRAPRRAPLLDRTLNLRPVRPLIARRLVAALRAKVRPEHYPAPFAIVDLWREHGAVGQASYEAEARSISTLMCTPTSRNLVRVFMLQDRLKGLGGKPPADLKRLHVVGAGVMGGDIAAWAALRGLEVTLEDRSQELIEPALGRARLLFEKRLREHGALDAALARLRADPAGEGVGDADVVIEAIFENVEAKCALLARLESRLKPHALLATNTSSIRIETLTPALAQPGRLVGVHFFNPVAQMQLIEVVRGEASDAAAVSRALQFTRVLDKLPLPCRSAPGFVVNRVLMPYLNESLFALAEGIPAAVIDRAGVRFGMPMGPIELTDVVGLDVALSVGEVLAKAFGRTAPDVLAERVRLKKLGRKSGEGFYVWKDGEPVREAARDADIPADLEDRLILPMVNEAAACLREGVVEDADLLDAGAIFGTGFAPFRGGPVNYARARGLTEVHSRLEQLEQRHGARFRPDQGLADLAATRASV
jgi:3-hydroxyacyl-CoA dehydrogenase/enoyl-CoA hydratase/3-hydroxybutyryl-CoA epimerase